MRKELLLIPLILLTACASDVFVISAYNNTYENLTVIGVSGGVAYFNSSNGIVSITDFLFNETTKELYVNGSLVCTVANGVCNASGTDLNNYTTGISFTRSGNIVTLDLSRTGMSNLSASFTDNTSGSTNTFGYGLNVSGDHVTIANLTACNPATEYSVWDGTEWTCDNDGSGTDTNNYTTNISFVGRVLNLARDGMVNLTASLIDDSILLNWLNITGRPTDLANFTNTPGYITSAPNINVTNFREANSTTAQLNLSDGRVLNATLSFGTGSGNGNITGSGTVAGEGVYSYNATDLRTNKILYVEPNNGSDIQAKINQCGSTGCTVIIPTGTYSVSTPIELRNGINLIGAGHRNTILSSSATTGAIIRGNLTGRIYDASIRNLQIEGNDLGANGLDFTNVSTSYIEDVYIFNTKSGLVLNGEGYYNTFIHLFVVSGEIGINASNNANQNTFVGGWANNNNVSNIYIYNDIDTLKFMSFASEQTSSGTHLIVNGTASYISFLGARFESGAPGGIIYLGENTSNINFFGSSFANTALSNLNNTNQFYGETNTLTTLSVVSADEPAAFTVGNGSKGHMRVGGSFIDDYPSGGLELDSDGTYVTAIDDLRTIGNDISGSENVNRITFVTGGINVTGTLNVSSNIYTNNKEVCTIDNGICINSTTDSNGGWINNSQNTSTSLKVGINKTGALYALDVSGVISSGHSSATSGSIRLRPSNAQSWFWMDNNGSNYIRFSSGSNPGTNPFVFTSNGLMGIANTEPNNTLDISGTFNVSGNAYTNAGLFSNGSQVCTAANGLCAGAGGGNVSSVNGTAGLPAIWSSATNLVAQLISNFMIGNKAVNSSQLNTSNAGSSGQYLMLNSTGGLEWNTVTSSGGSGNITGNLTSGNIPYAANSTHLENSRLTQNSTANTVAGDWFVNNYVQDRTNQNYMNILETEFCPGNIVNNAAYNGFTSTSISSGIVGSIQANQSHPCILGMGDSTTANGGVLIRTGADSFRINGTENATFIWKQTAAQDQYIRTIMGFFDTSNMAEPTDGCMFYMQMNNHSGQNNQIQGRCSSSSVSRNTTNNYTFTNNTWYISKIEINEIATNVTFKIYNESGSLLWNNSVGTNIPVNVGRETGFGVMTSQNNTDAASTYLHMDYMGLLIKKQLRNIVYNG